MLSGRSAAALGATNEKFGVSSSGPVWDGPAAGEADRVDAGGGGMIQAGAALLCAAATPTGKAARSMAGNEDRILRIRLLRR